MTAALDAATTLVEQIFAEPRLASVQGCDGTTIVVRVDVPDLATNRLHPTLLCHRRAVGGEWKVAWSSTGTAATVTDNGSVVYVREHQGVQEIRVRDRMDYEMLIHYVNGMVAEVAWEGVGGRLACTVLESGLTRASPDALRGSDAIWFDSQRASLGRARRFQGDWRVWLLDGDPAPLPFALPEDAELTGELAWLQDGQIVLGVTYFLHNGGQRFGFMVVDAHGRVLRKIRHEHIDLTAPVAAPGGAYLACLCTTLPADGTHLVQYTCLLSAEGVLSVPALEGELWQQPYGWTDDQHLVCLADDGPRRRLYIHDLMHGASKRVEVGASVLDLACRSPCIAVLASTPDSPPALLTIDADGSALQILIRSSAIALPGAARHVVLNDHRVDSTLGAWLCMPHSGTAAGLIAIFHGGPLKSWTDWAWRWNPWPFVAAGFAVALVEPPMSLGYGDAAIAAGWRRWRTGIASIAVRQIKALREASGLGDCPLALMGGSFGGYLALVTGATMKPRLVVTHGCPVDLAQVAATSDVFWQWLREYGDPEAHGAEYTEQSFRDAGALARTRVLISHGLHDDLVTPSESLRLHRALLRSGGRSELAVFTGERHALLKPLNLRAWFSWVLQACDNELRCSAKPGTGWR